MNIRASRSLAQFLAVVCIFASALARAAEPGVLTQAVLDGALQAARSAIGGGAEVNAIDPVAGHAPLHTAVSPGGPREREMIELLISKGALLDAIDPTTQLTPLAASMVVTERGPFAQLERTRAANIAEALLNGGANPNQALKEGESPLMLAVAMNNLQVVQLLLARGANPNLRDVNQSTALHVAYATERSATMIEALTASGADPSLRDAQGRLPHELRPQFVSVEPPAPTPAAPASVTTPSPAELTSEPAKSSMTKWLIGGAVVATAVAGSVVLAHLMKEQKRKKANGAATGNVAPVPAPAPLIPVSPPAAVASVVSCVAPRILQNGACVAPPPAAPVVARIKDFGLMSVKRRTASAESFILGSAAESERIEFVEGDSFTLYVDIDDKITEPATVRFSASEPNVFPVPASLVVQPNVAGTGPAASCRTHVSGGTCPQYRVLIPVRIGNLEWAHTVDVANRHNVTITAATSAGSRTIAYVVAHVVPPVIETPPAAPAPPAPPLPPVALPGCIAPRVLDNGACVIPPPRLPSPLPASPSVQIKDFGLYSVKLNAGQAAESFVLGNALESNAGTIKFVEGDIATLFLDIDQMITEPLTVRLSSSELRAFPVPATVLVQPSPANYTLPSSCRSHGPPGPCPQYRIFIPVRFGAAVSGQSSSTIVMAATSAGSRSISIKLPEILPAKPTPLCTQGSTMVNGVCVVIAPPVISCVMPLVLQGGACVSVQPICAPPQELQNGVCGSPPVVPPPAIVSASPVDLAALLRLAFNDGPGSVTVNWTGTAAVVVTNVSIAYTWPCASGARTFAPRAAPAPGAMSVVVPWFTSDTGIGCPEFPAAGPGNAPASAVINLTYRVNGTGPDLVVSRSYGQVACLTFFPDQAAFPINVVVSEAWSDGAKYQFDRSLINPYGLASFYGLDDATLNNVFQSCNGRFIPASGSKTRAPTAADPQLYSDTVEAANGILTMTEQVTRPGAAISENVIFSYRYSIATGEYSLSTSGGQRNASGASSVVSASRAGRVKVRVEVRSP